jgi:hypothetical protein
MTKLWRLKDQDHAYSEVYTYEAETVEEAWRAHIDHLYSLIGEAARVYETANYSIEEILY